jgi:hypothetical protein
MPMIAYLPGAADLAGAAGLVLALALFLVLGAAVSGRRTLPEIQVVAGWGVASIVLTLWAVVTPLSLRLPLAALGLTAAACIAIPHFRRRIGPLGAIGRMAALAIPLWMVVLPMRPSQIDTWLNLLPNAAYLFDHDMLPRADRPPSWSFLPVAPYNSQFPAYIASVASGSFAAGAMGLFNVILLAAGGLLLARVVSGCMDRTPPWWACAAGLLLAIPLNPGFVPRSFFAAYGEPSLAVATLFAVWLAAKTIEDMAADRPAVLGAALACVLAALVNIKQSGIGLLLPIGFGLLVFALGDRRIARGRALATTAGILAPSIILYGAWRIYATTSFAAGELQPLPLAAWNFALLPQILWAMAVETFQKATFYLCTGAVVAAALWRLRAKPRKAESVQLGLIAVVTILFNGFILATYVMHFPPEMALQAHSFFRYGTQLSLIVMLGLVIVVRPYAERIAGRLPQRARLARLGIVAATLLFPVVLAPLFRFDLTAPQPALWDLGHHVAADVNPHARLALLVPGDQDDAVGSMLRGVMLFTGPRRPGLDFRTEARADQATLDAAARAGYTLALVTCTPQGLAGVPSNVAALLALSPTGWQPIGTWPWPIGLERERFTALLARGPLCANRRRRTRRGKLRRSAVREV